MPAPGKRRMTFDADRVEVAVLDVGELGGEPDGAVQARLGAGRRLPHAPRRVDARVEPGDVARTAAAGPGSRDRPVGSSAVTHGKYSAP